MRLAVISSRFPCANTEPFLGVELAALRPLVERLVVAPLRPDTGMQHGTGGAAAILVSAWSARALLEACATFARAPGRSLRALAAILCGSGGLVVKLKNLAVFPRALALAGRLRRERIDHVHAYWLSTPATAAFVIARVNAIGWSCTAHRWDIFEENMIVEKARSAAFVRTISERGKGELVRRVPEVAGKVNVVRLGTGLFGASAGTRPGNGLRLICAAAYVAPKGHADLLEAFAIAYDENPGLHLTLCGEGPLREYVRERASALPCRNAVVVGGYLDRRRLLTELGAGRYDAVILASRDDGVRMMEGIPSILIEAASLGVTCIATRSGGIGELLDEESAFLAPPQRPKDLARAILDATDPSERSRRAARALERARRMHDPQRTAAQLRALLGGARAS
ncbi:MAG: glycosyltransferase [Candidatus Tyrphobacter sp.]